MSARDDVLAGQLALGALDARAHARATRRMQRDPDFHALVEEWQIRLADLEPATDATAPSPAVWTGIETALDDLAVIPGTRTVRRTQGAWETLAPGIEKKLLSVDPDTGAQSYLVRLAAGATLPPHGHDVAEECIVLEGELRVGEIRIGPGEFHLAPAGVRHPPITTRTGALFFILGAL